MRKRRLGKLRSPRWMRQGTSWLSHRVHNMTRAQRIICASIASVVLLSVTVPTALIIIKNQSYKLSAEIQQLVGTPNKNLSAKITYNSEKDSWQFNQSNIPIGSGTGNSGPQDAAMPSVADLKSQVGGGGKKDESLYAVDMPAAGNKGVTYYDTNTDLSFSLVPNFKVSEGRQSDGHIVYPAENGAKLIYTAKTNGMKEDIVLTKPIGDEASFSYQLKLPEYLQAKIQDDGSLGVFSPDPILFGNISFDDGQDREKIMSARKTAAKDHLLFVLPAPFVVEAGGTRAKAHSKFVLAGDTLTVKSTGLEGLKYPLSIDPSVVVTSASDFATGGNNEGMIAFDTTNNLIKRSGLTGGTVGSWNTTTGISTVFGSGRSGIGTTTHNGYMYVLGGYNGIAQSSTAYAPISSNGTVGTWTTTTALPAVRMASKAIAYNGYMYVIGGTDGGGTFYESVLSAPINSNGTLGSWTSLNSYTGQRSAAGAAIYNGYLYVSGGEYNNYSSVQTDTQYAPIKADGTLGTWATTTALPSGRSNHGMVAYNNYMYIVGGNNTSGTVFNQVRRAAINSDGTIGSWATEGNLPATITGGTNGTMIYNGYLYIAGGFNGSGRVNTVYYAPLQANGAVGTWNTTTAFTTARTVGGLVASNGYVYVVAGELGNDVTFYSDIQYATIKPAGTNSDYALGNTFTTKRRGAPTVIYNNYVYVLGGETLGDRVSTVRQAPINADGSFGTFTTGRAIPAAMGFHAAVAYRGYMYVLGGCTTVLGTCTTAGNNVATVYRSAIASDGSLGVWNTDTSFTTARYGLSAVAHGGYLYVLGGLNGSTFQNDIQYHAIGASGAISGAWSTSSQTISTARAYMGAAVDGGKLYIAGGCSAGALTCATAQSDIQYATLGASGDLTGAFTNNGTSLPTARGMHGFVIADGYAYAVGGWGGGTTFYDDTQFAPMNSNGSIGSWTAGEDFLETDEMQAAMGVVANAGYLYAIGGWYNNGIGDSISNYTQRARLHGGGPGVVDATWTSVTGPGSSRSAYSVAISSDYLYIVGGTISGSSVATVYYAPINADGSIGSWTPTSSLVAARSNAAIYSIGNYLYVAGGNNGSPMTSSEYTAINSDGTLGSWSTATATLSAARDSSAYTEYDGHAYYIGGNNSTPQTTVYYADLSAGGNFSSWSTTTALPTGVKDASAVAYNGYLYVLGGTTSSGDIGEVIYAPINSNGTLGSWTAASWIPSSGITSATAANGMMYVLGTGVDRNKTYRAAIHADGSLGQFEVMRDMSNASTITIPRALYAGGRLYSFRSGGDTQYSGVDSVARIGSYSKTINLGGDYDLSTITYGGALPDERTHFKYQAASSSGVLGSLQSPFDLTGGGVGCGGGGGSTRYVRLSATFDDTLSSVYPDTNSSAATITDMTIDYTSSSSSAPPNLRMMHGKFFSGETIQPLDTCAS